MKKRTTTLEPTYHGKTIMTDSHRNLACDTKILDEIEKQFDHATKNNSKVFFMRMDTRVAQESGILGENLFTFAVSSPYNLMVSYTSQ